MNDEKTITITYTHDTEPPFPVTIDKDAVDACVRDLRGVADLDVLTTLYALWEHNTEHTIDVYRAIAHDYLMRDIVEGTVRTQAIVKIVADRSPEEIEQFVRRVMLR